MVLTGAIASEPAQRLLPSGSTAVQFDVRTALDDTRPVSTTTVPVSWIDPLPGSLTGLGVGEAVVVVGTVRRRFFRAGGVTQSRTEVVAERVVPTRRTKSARAALAAAARSLGD